MGLLKNLIKGIGQDKKVIKEKLKDAEQDRKVQKILDEREKSSNHRELERFMHEKEEERITNTLKKIRKQKDREVWHGKHQILKSDCNILDNDRPLLKEKNVFKNNKRIFSRKLNNSMGFFSE